MDNFLVVNKGASCTQEITNLISFQWLSALKVLTISQDHIVLLLISEGLDEFDEKLQVAV